MVDYHEIYLGSEKVLIHMSDQIHQARNQWDCKRHNNAEFELHFILRGSCSLDVENTAHTLNALDTILIAPGQYHLPTPQPGEFERFSLSFSLSEGALSSRLGEMVPCCKIYSITPEIYGVCQEVFRECSVKTPYHHEMLHALLTKLIIDAFRRLHIVSGEASPKKQTAQFYTGKIDNFFETHWEGNLGAEDLAAQLHISRRQLARILQQQYGMGFREKLLRTRMDRAAWLLRNSNKPVSVIAYEVGYASESAFYISFRENFAQTPAQYREAQLQQAGTTPSRSG